LIHQSSGKGPMLQVAALALLSHSSFEACVSSGLGEAALLVLPGHDDFTLASQCVNRRSDIQSTPDAVVRVESVADVQAAVRCAAAFGLEVSTRAGGWSPENESCRGKVIVDLHNLMGFSYDNTTQLVTWGSGHTSGQLYLKLADEDMMLPLPYDPEIRVASTIENTEMLWMARGGGGEFPGIVTKFTALAAPLPSVMHELICEHHDASDIGKESIAAWVRGQDEISKSLPKTGSRLMIVFNIDYVKLKHWCFDCNASELAFFESHTTMAAERGGGSCFATTDWGSGRAHPKQVINFLAGAPSMTRWTDMIEKPYTTWPRQYAGAYDHPRASGSYYAPTAAVVDGAIWDAVWPIFNRPPFSTAGSYVQQMLMYPLASDFVAADTVGHAHNGDTAKWLIFFAFSWPQDEYDDDAFRKQERTVSSTFGSYLPCKLFYNFYSGSPPCATSKEERLAAHFSDPQRMQQIKQAHDPTSGRLHCLHNAFIAVAASLPHAATAIAAQATPTNITTP
ncbi:MAG: hypothetical protein SGPRY_004892, partial [Prymnesium sp.]